MFATLKNKIFPTTSSSSNEDSAALMKSPSPSSEHEGNGTRSASQGSKSCNVERHWAVAMAETICVAGCSCIFCRRRPQATPDVESGNSRQRRRERMQGEADRAFHRSMAPTSSIMQVLYPTSFTSTPSDLPAEHAPPAYRLHVSGAPGNGHARRGTGPRPGDIFSDNVAREGITQSHVIDAQPATLSEGSTETLIMPPTPGRRIHPVRQLQDPGHRGPLIGLGLEDMGYSQDGSVPPPAYTRFDAARPRFPMAADVLGPYPHISVLAPQAGDRTSL
ncbi:hypothetical protein BV22DRAFT_1135058 [Leucogyrophana mollusca]|uniref:Uncharacterized protein n=1 Tax=Leucogyrophana mollusca TaxID=85980 RepID=A0ACB8AWV5_9AGAM|nr:hypothetical protein BV22DRAFT_1135058 [Leucogyrophana mollusca]